MVIKLDNPNEEIILIVNRKVSTNFRIIQTISIDKNGVTNINRKVQEIIDLELEKEINL